MSTNEPMAELDRLRRRRDAAQIRLLTAVTKACPGPHHPTKHRDNKPAWCARCGRTADGVPVVDPTPTGQDKG